MAQRYTCESRVSIGSVCVSNGMEHRPSKRSQLIEYLWRNASATTTTNVWSCVCCMTKRLFASSANKHNNGRSIWEKKCLSRVGARVWLCPFKCSKLVRNTKCAFFLFSCCVWSTWHPCTYT